MTEPIAIPYLCNEWYQYQYSFHRVVQKGYAIKPFETLDEFLDHIKENKHPLFMIDLGVAPGRYRDEVIEEILKRNEDQGHLYFTDYAEIGLQAIKMTQEISDAPIIITSDTLQEKYNEKAKELGVSKVLNMMTDDFEPGNILTTIEGLLAE